MLKFVVIQTEKARTCSHSRQLWIALFKAHYPQKWLDLLDFRQNYLPCWKLKRSISFLTIIFLKKTYWLHKLRILADLWRNATFRMGSYHYVSVTTDVCTLLEFLPNIAVMNTTWHPADLCDVIVYTPFSWYQWTGRVLSAHLTTADVKTIKLWGLHFCPCHRLFIFASESTVVHPGFIKEGGGILNNCVRSHII